MKKTVFFILAIILIAVVALVIINAGRTKTVPGEQKTPVAVITVLPETLNATVNVTGDLKPATSVDVSSRVGGQLTYVVGRSGTKISKGQVIARVDSTDMKIQLKNANAALNSAKARLSQAEATYVQQRVSTDNGVLTAQANLSAAKARLAQAKSTYESSVKTLNAQLKQAEEGLVSAESRLDLIKTGARPQERELAEANVRSAKANMSKAQTDYDSMKNMYDNGAVSRNTFLSYETALTIAKEQYNNAMQSLDLVKEGATSQDIQMAESAVRQAKAAVDAAKANVSQSDVQKDNVLIAETGVAQASAALESAKSSVYIDKVRDKDITAARAGIQQAQAQVDNVKQSISYATITSPVSGVIQTINVERGQNIGAGTPLFTVATDSSFYFESQVSELEASSLKAGDPISITIDALSDVKVSGYVDKIVPVVDNKTRNFTVRVVMPTVEGLYSGMFARGIATTDSIPSTIVIPRNAVTERNNISYVFIAKDDVAIEKEIKLGIISGSNVQVLSGIEFGDQLIVSGQQGLADKDKILIESVDGKLVEEKNNNKDTATKK